MLQDHITAHTEGSISLTHPAFANGKAMGNALRLLRFYPGVKGVKLDEASSALHIEYDAKRLNKDKVMDLLAQGEKWINSQK